MVEKSIQAMGLSVLDILMQKGWYFDRSRVVHCHIAATNTAEWKVCLLWIPN
jgi:hypothetical protein